MTSINPNLKKQDNWKPLRDNKSNFSIVKNQQSNPIAVIIEKITDSIDAILTKQCLEVGIDPRSEETPQSLDETVQQFFPDRNWDLQTMRGEQAEEIQVIVNDNGEGQRP